MVVAEVPLWVVHSNANAPGSNKNGEQAKNGKANQSLLLLDGSTTNGGLQKAAIYSVDVHGNRFATGGGDGTVRIWNAGALFPKPKSYIKNKYKRVGVVSDEDANETTLGNTLATATANKTYDSSGESSLDETIPPSSPDSVRQTKLPSSPVRDLSSIVRRKGEASKQPAPGIEKDKNATTKNNNNANITAKHRLLCTLSAHTGSSVLAVRFSNNGNYLASAGDDAVVCVYAKQDSSATQNNLETNVEHWVRIKLCRGHGLDAVGLAWAPDDSHLVSCSLDSKTPIIVWKLTDLAEEKPSNHNFYQNVLCNPYKILGKGIHTSTVKGVTFDPAGTYLASSGDDPSVCVWRAHDDWGLEQRIDSKSGIFRKWNSQTNLASQSLFRRLSWSTDGAYICATNAVVKNKNVASTISREGWAVSSSKTATGAVNLVGHKQPVVVACHCPYLLAAGQMEDDSDGEPEYSTLLALGDKRGFVTVWSTRKARPIFKIQCSETRCTVTDLSWGRLPLEHDSNGKNAGDLMLLVSLLDGQVVALRFGIPDEFGKLLSDKDQARVFQLRYGIDINDVGRQLFVGDSSGKPKLIENALQFTLEHSHQHTVEDEEMPEQESRQQAASPQKLSSDEIRTNQLESRKGGKKRIQPLLMQTTALPVAKKPKVNAPKEKVADTLETAVELAEKAASGAAAAQKTVTKTAPSTQMVAANGQAPPQQIPQQQQQQQQIQHHSRPNIQLLGGIQSTPQIPHSTDRIHSVDLPTKDEGERCVADCTNSIKVPKGSSGTALPMTVLSISKGGRKLWNDQLLGSSCCAIAAIEQWLVVGTSDGCLYIYGTSPTLGWKSTTAIRAHPPFVLGRPIVSLHLHQQKDDGDEEGSKTKLLVVTSDGNFAVYGLKPRFTLLYKGSLLPAMTHMLLSADLETDIYLPKLARIQITDTNRLLLLLSLQSPSGRTNDHEGGPAKSVGAGGSLQGFIYDKASELWIRVADSRFVLSDFYKTLPSVKKSKSELDHLDDSVRMGATASSLQRSRRSRSAFVTSFSSGSDSANDVASRSHCEDRMACALSLGLAPEFEEWFAKYIKILAATGNELLLRMVVDMLLVGEYKGGEPTDNKSDMTCWWLSHCGYIFDVDRVKLVKKIVIPEMSKNRALQRITNEIAIEAEEINVSEQRTGNY